MIPGSLELTNGVTTVHVAPENLRIYWSEESVKGRADAEAGTLSPDDLVRVMQNTILACARRNHPELTMEQLCEVLDVADIVRVHSWVKTKSGLTQPPLGQSAGTTSPAPTSSGTSSTPQDGSPTTSSTA